MSSECAKGGLTAPPSTFLSPAVKTLGCDRVRHARAAGLLGQRVAGGQRGHLGTAAGRRHAGALLRVVTPACSSARTQHLARMDCIAMARAPATNRHALLQLLPANADVHPAP